MILIDLSQTLYSVLLVNQSENLDLPLARSMIFTTLLSYKKKFGSSYGEPILAMDSREGYWRRDLFSHYKASRKKARETDKEKWETIFKIVNQVKDELLEVLPWKIIYVPTAEADDIIGVMALAHGDHQDVLILSSDKDYKQLQVKKKVVQYSPIMKKWIRSEDPRRELQELILTGDGGDGIPNIKSPADAFVTGTRQTPITKKFKEEFISSGKGYREHQERYDLNEQLIDLTKVPEHIKDAILKESLEPPKGSMNKLYRFLVSNRMNLVLKDIDLFKVKANHELHPANIFFQ